MEKKNTARTNATQLATAGEVASMIETESVREPIPVKKDVHFPDFSTVVRWLEMIGIGGGIFTDDIDLKELMRLGTEMKKELVDKTLEFVGKGKVEIFADITKYLGEEDEASRSDVIVVFGSSDLSRIEKGVELWKLGIAPTLAITGGQPYYAVEKVPEAVLFARRAIELGVPKDKILIDPNSINIPDNVKTILNMMDGLGFDYSKDGITIVSAWFTLRRIWAHMMKLSREGVKIHRTSPMLDSGRLMREKWFDNELGISIIFNEFVKMRSAILANNIA